MILYLNFSSCSSACIGSCDGGCTSNCGFNCSGGCDASDCIDSCYSSTCGTSCGFNCYSSHSKDGGEGCLCSACGGDCTELANRDSCYDCTDSCYVMCGLYCDGGCGSGLDNYKIKRKWSTKLHFLFIFHYFQNLHHDFCL